FLPRAVGLLFFADPFGCFADAFNFSLSLASFFVSFSILATRRRIFLPRVLTFIKPQAPMFCAAACGEPHGSQITRERFELSRHLLGKPSVSSERSCISFLCRSQMRRP